MGKSGRSRALVFAALGSIVAVLVFTCLYFLWQANVYNSSFAMDPDEFREQARRIMPGEPVADVRKRLRGVTRVSETSGAILFGMEPLTTRTAIREPRTQWIKVSFDANGRVADVSASEGRRVWRISAHDVVP